MNAPLRIGELLPAGWLAVLLLATACSTPLHHTLENPELAHRDPSARQFVNLFAPEYYPGKMHTELDDVDFLQPGERRARTYALISNPNGDIDRTFGYRGTEYMTVPDLSRIRAPSHAIQITWIRHATFLLQFGDDIRVLTDPMWSPMDGAAGLFAGFFDALQLHVEPPLSLREAGFTSQPDAADETARRLVVISHDHYDHLNWNTLAELPESTRFYVPLGLEKEFPGVFNDVLGMDWYTNDGLAGLTIHFLPANHRSGRSLSDGNRTLWGGWLFEWQGRRVYFSGDSGYSPVFSDIRKRLGPMDICLLPITAWFQRHWHFAPEDAIRAAVDLDCRVLIPWGYGAWVLGYEHMLEPVRRLRHAWDGQPPADIELRVLKMGETYGLEPAPAGDNADQSTGHGNSPGRSPTVASAISSPSPR